MPNYPQPTEYLITFVDTRKPAMLWCAIDEEQVRRDMFERGHLIQKIEVSAESEWGQYQEQAKQDHHRAYETEQKRIDEEQRYKAEMETAAGGLIAS